MMSGISLYTKIKLDCFFFFFGVFFCECVRSKYEKWSHAGNKIEQPIPRLKRNVAEICLQWNSVWLKSDLLAMIGNSSWINFEDKCSF